MKIVMNATGILDTGRPAQGLRDMVEAGFGEILLDTAVIAGAWEFEVFGKEHAGDKRHSGKTEDIAIVGYPEEFRARLVKLMKTINASDTRAAVIRAPRLGWDTKREGMNVEVERLAAETVRAAGDADVIVRPLFAGISREDMYGINREFFLRLAREAPGNDAKILIEHCARNVGGHLTRGFLSEGKKAAEFIDDLNTAFGSGRFGICVDTGLLNLTGQSVYEYMTALGDRVHAVILRENDGMHDTSMLPFTAVRSGGDAGDMLGVIRGLREIGFDRSMIIDASSSIGMVSHLMRIDFLKYAHKIAEYLLWQAEIEKHIKRHKKIVLFGAGNMCRNYMKCYGSEYPPLFTCDNNKALWGTELEGLEVKDPSCLKDIDDDTCVMICNIFYREVEAQLRELGVKNTAYFSDEYLPSYYTDRV